MQLLVLDSVEFMYFISSTFRAVAGWGAYDRAEDEHISQISNNSQVIKYGKYSNFVSVILSIKC